MRVALDNPIGGLHVDTAVSEQPPGTTRQVANMRPICRKTSRRRLSTRGGLGDILSGLALSGTSAVRALASFVRNKKRTTFAESVPPTVEWSFVGDSGDSARGVKHDAQGNTYWLAGRDHVVMRNSAGVVVWKLVLPVDDQSQIVRAFDITPDGGLIFCGVSEGSDQEKTHLWAYAQQSNVLAPVQLWEITAVGFVQQCVYHEGRLYTIQDFPAEGASALIVYRGAETATPAVDTAHTQLPFPTAGLAVGPDGAAYVASPENISRGIDPRYPDLSPVRVDWSLGDLDRVSERVWAHYRADTPSLLTTPDDGDTLTQIDDLSGNGRHLYATTGETGGVQWIEQGVGALPALRFSGTLSGFESRANLNSNTDPERLLTMLPSYAGARWAAFMLFRRTDPASTGRECLFEQGMGTNGGDSHRLTGNEDETGAGTPAGNNLLTWQTDASPNTWQKDAIYEEFTLATLIWNIDGAGKCLYRVNGTPWSRFTNVAGTQGALTEKTFFAWDGTSERFAGDLIEVIVLRDYKDSTGATQLVTCPAYPDAAWVGVNLSDTDVERIEGSMMWERGLQHVLDDGTVTGIDVSNLVTAQPWPHPFHLRKRFTVKDAAITTGAFGSILTKTGAFANYLPTLVTGKFDSIEVYEVNGNGVENQYVIKQKLSNDAIELATIIGTTTTLASAAYLGFAFADVETNTGGPPQKKGRPPTVTTAYWRNNFSYPAVLEEWTGNELTWSEGRTSGVGYGVAVRSLDLDEDGTFTTYLWSLGPHYRNLATYLRKYEKQGNAFVAVNGLGSLAGQVINPDYPYARIDVDKFGTVYFPFHDPDTGYAGGIQSVGWTPFDFATGLNVFKLPNGQQGFAVSIDPNVPDYESDPVARAEFLYVATRNESDPTKTTQHRLRMVTRTLDAGAPPRERIDIGVAGGNVRRFETGTPVDIPGGTGALVADSPWTTLMDFGGELFMLDGKGYQCFTKKSVIEPWTSTSAGEIPRGCKIGMVWNGRVWVARGDDPYLWACSAKDDARNWDFDPAVAVATQAVTGPLSPMGRTPEMITALIPWTDATRDERVGSVAVFGCDHSIYVAEGDPGTGTLYQKTTGLGIAPGPCPGVVSPEGTLYFLNEDGQFCYWPLGGFPRAISEGRVDQRFREIDLSAYGPFLVYDRRERGVHIYLVPWAPTHAVRVDHYFFCEASHGIQELGVTRTGAFGTFWPDTFGEASIQPVCALTRDGDLPDDRDLILGCSDGKIRKVSGEYDDDDGNLIASEVTYGPLVPRGKHEQMMFTAFQVELAEGQFGCQAQVFAHTAAKESLGHPTSTFLCDPGLNERAYSPSRGTYCYVKLASPVPFSVEGISCEMVPGGMKRRA